MCTLDRESCWTHSSRKEEVHRAMQELNDLQQPHPFTRPLFEKTSRLSEAMELEQRGIAAAQLYGISKLLSQRRHPLHQRLLSLLQSFRGTPVEVELPRPPSVREVMEEFGVPVQGDDVSGSLRRYLKQHRDALSALEHRLQLFEARYAQVARGANVLSALCAALTGLLLVVLMAMTGVITIQWDPLPIEEPAEQTLPAPLPKAGESESRDRTP